MGINHSTDDNAHPSMVDSRLSDSGSEEGPNAMEVEAPDSQEDHEKFTCVSGSGLAVSNYVCVNSDPDHTLAAAKMLLQLREGHQVSQVALTEVVSGCGLLCNLAFQQMKADMCKFLNCTEEGVTFHVDVKVYDPFHNVDTNYLFEKYCVDHLGCLVSYNTYCLLLTDILHRSILLFFRKQRKFRLVSHTTLTNIQITYIVRSVKLTNFLYFYP